MQQRGVLCGMLCLAAAESDVFVCGCETTVHEVRVCVGGESRGYTWVCRVRPNWTAHVLPACLCGRFAGLA